MSSCDMPAASRAAAQPAPAMDKCGRCLVETHSHRLLLQSRIQRRISVARLELLHVAVFCSAVAELSFSAGP